MGARRIARWVLLGLLPMGIALVCTRPAAARRISTEFNYQFDVGGDTMEFEGGAGELKWKPGGALGSVGCLKVTGADAVAERFNWFKAGESYISFHYLLHGYELIRCRLNLVQADQREKFGNYGQFLIRNPAQDEWKFLQFKITDLKGDGPGKPQFTPDIVFKSFTIIAAGGGPESYMLLDNIRLGPKIEEKDIVVRQRGSKTFGKQKITLLDFEKPEEAQLVHALDDLTTEHSFQFASTGKGCLKLTCAKDKPWTSFELDGSLLKGWEQYDYLSIDFYTEDPHTTRFTVEFWDPATKGYPTRSTFEGQADMKIVPVHKGNTRCLVDLRKARRNNKEGLSSAELRKEDMIDFAKLTKVKAWFCTQGYPKDYVVYMDNIRLLQEGALESNMKIDLPQGAIAFDFGENSPLVEGFTEVGVADIYSDEKGYGFVNPDKLHCEGRDWPDALTGDYVAGGHTSGEMSWTQAGFEFRVKVPNGKYLVWACIGYFPYPNLYIDADLNGDMLFEGEMKGSRFYSPQWFYRFINTDYSEKPNALWKNYVAKMYPAHIMETEVKTGTFYVKGMNSFLSALILLPADRKAEFDKMTQQIESERIRYFYKDIYCDRPENEPCRLTDDNMVLFTTTKSIMPWSGIGEQDKTEVKLVATPGEPVLFQAAIRPFRDLGTTKLQISDLEGPAGARISAKQAEITLKKYLSNGANVFPWCLMPTDTVELEKGLTRTFYVRLRVPDDAKPGTYKATVTATAGPVVKSLPVEVQVYPFRLEDNIPLSIGFYYSPPDDGQFAMYNAMANFQAERDRMLKEQMELLKDYGMTSVQLPGIALTGLRGSGVTVNTDAIAKVANAAKAAGLLANKMQRAQTYTLGVARSLAGMIAPDRSIGIGEELKLTGFATAFVSAMRQLVEWSEDADVPLVLWVVDEPRESPNPWNRNLDDTIEYLKLCAKVKGAIRMVTPMGDRNSGKDYTPLLDYLEIVATHPGSNSAKMIQRAMTDPKLELWIYNAGQDRASNGFYLWRVGATGKHEWHYNMFTAEKTKGGYMGSDIHNPFIGYEYTGATVPAPLNYKGGVLFREGMLTMSQGAYDYRYLYTLEREIAQCKQAGKKAAEVAEAERFLEALKAAIPVLPDVKNLVKEEDLALVGGGLEGGWAQQLEAWRKKVADLIVKLKE